MRLVWTMTITVFCLGIGTCSLSAAGLDADAAAWVEAGPPPGQAAGDDSGYTFTLVQPTPGIRFLPVDDQKPLYPERFDFQVADKPANSAAPAAPSSATPTPAPSGSQPTLPAVVQVVMQATAPAQSSISAVELTAGDSFGPLAADFTLLPLSGLAMYYNPGVMQEVYAYRLGVGQIQPCSACVGYAALLRAGDINRHIWLQWNNGVMEGPFLVIDVAASQHVTLLLSRGWVVDVDYETAMRRGMVGPSPVTVFAVPPALAPAAE